MAVCEQCGFINGELQDVCSKCQATLIAGKTAASSRVLAPHPSHEESPPKKTPKTSEGGDGVAHLTTMMEAMLMNMKEMKECMATKADLNNLKAGVEEAKTIARDAATNVCELRKSAVGREDVKNGRRVSRRGCEEEVHDDPHGAKVLS